ncbi:MAG TPA: PQQ-binding-like beta-propeller repeat protein [Chitinophagaceae bacterium]|nr:PQQ-binding-like beta-propeller repeat protein [Chitinophagaceae bacterium]
MVKLFTILIFMICSVVAAANDPVKPAVQTQFRGNEAHTGLYSDQSTYASVKQRWTFKTGHAIRSTPLIQGNKIYVGSGDHHCYALDTAGKLLWKFKADAPVHSSPALHKNTIYFTSRANSLYAIDAVSGKLKWHKQLGADLPYEWAFDYYISSPLVSEGILYTGSGDGNLYAINASNGSIQWKFNAGSRLRSTPAVYDNKIYVGDCAGKVYSLDKSGKLVWQFATHGDTMRNENFGFDRKAVIASPAIVNNIVVVGGRDGYLYGIDALTGARKWEYNYQVSWIISSVAIKDTIVVTGTSDGRFINALNLHTGKELWRFMTGAPVWASPSIVGDKVFNASNDGFVYCLNLYTGKEVWRFRTNDRLFSSPVPANGNLYVGNDEGMLFCLKSGSTPAPAPQRAVFWIKDPAFQYHRYGLDVYAKDFFASAGYKVLDQTALADFMRQRIADRQSSVVVFATNFFPSSIIGDTVSTNLLMQYLRQGGKVVITGMNPAVYVIDEQKRELKGVDFAISEKITGIPYKYGDTRAFGGFYPSTPTLEGKRWGLTTNMVTRNGMPPQDVTTVLATDEVGKATFWVKNYGGKQGTGFVQTWLFASTLTSLSEILQVAEYGL